MPICECCENDYDKCFDIIKEGKKHTFDSFECAIETLAPHCAYCDCKIIGHGLEKNNKIFCCANCARAAGTSELKDHA